MRRFLPLLLVPILATLAVSAFAADAPPAAQFEGRVDVREVLLDVLVTDRQGNVIVGLEPKDFRVTENGKPVDLAGLSFYSNRKFLGSTAEAAKRAIAADAPLENRYFILLFNDVRMLAIDAPSLLSQQLQAARKAQEWFKGLLPNDWVAVATFDTKLKIHTDFTRDRRTLDAAIAEVVGGKDPETEWPSRVGNGATGASAAPSLLAHLPQGKALRDKTVDIYDAMTVLSNAAEPITGRKNLLLFSIGFGRISEFGQYLPDTQHYKPAQQALNDANVAVYTIDLWPAGTDHTLSSGLNLLASDTGGTYLFNFVNFATPLQKILEENNGYYLLAYKSERPAGAEGFQKVEVKLVNPEFKVKAREGYSYGKRGAS
ncbi:MAG: VWA domain-containing protein [Acidobacteriota bacterium]